MGEYYLSSSKEAKERYEAKLNSVGLSLVDDPYLSQNHSKFSTEILLWPSIEYGHIFSYYIKRPGTFTQEELMSWKQLEAYNYFKSGHVRTIYGLTFGSGERCVTLKAAVNPSQKAPDQANQAWIVAKLDGRIVCGHCTYWAG